MLLIDDAREYWQIISRAKQHDFNRLIVTVAIKDLNMLIAKTKSDVVRARALRWISNHQPKYHSKPPRGDGPRYA